MSFTYRLFQQNMSSPLVPRIVFLTFHRFCLASIFAYSLRIYFLFPCPIFSYILITSYSRRILFFPGLVFPSSSFCRIHALFLLSLGLISSIHLLISCRVLVFIYKHSIPLPSLPSSAIPIFSRRLPFPSSRLFQARSPSN